MKKNSFIVVFCLIIILLFVYVYSIKSTTAVVHLTELNNRSAVIVSDLGEKRKVLIPPRLDVSDLNEQSRYLVDYESSIIRRSTFSKIEEIK